MAFTDRREAEMASRSLNEAEREQFRKSNKELRKGDGLATSNKGMENWREEGRIEALQCGCLGRSAFLYYSKWHK